LNYTRIAHIDVPLFTYELAGRNRKKFIGFHSDEQSDAQ